MEIAGILTAGKFLSSALDQLSKRSQPQEATASPPAETPTTPAGRAAATAALREIAARYDVTHISPREFSEMLRKLYDAGALTDAQFQELSQIRVDLDLDRVDPDEALNLVDFYLAKLGALRQSADDSQGPSRSPSVNAPAQAAAVEGRLRWLESFAAIQAAPELAALDTLA